MTEAVAMTESAPTTEADIPTLESVLRDSVHGSAWISLRALEVLRHRAQELATAGAEDDVVRAEIVDLGERLAVARPPMVSVFNRVRRFLDQADEIASSTDAGLAEKLSTLATTLLAEAEESEAQAVAHAAELVRGKCVFTLSRSSTVLRAILQADPAPRVVVAESLPGGEGRGVAQELAGAGIEVTLVPDSIMATVLSSAWDPAVDLVLVGADTVSPEGDVVNKSGTRLAALAAQAGGIPCYAVLTEDKILTQPEIVLEESGLTVASSRGEPRRVEPVFELTPAELFTGLILSDGLRPVG